MDSNKNKQTKKFNLLLSPDSKKSPIKPKTYLISPINARDINEQAFTSLNCKVSEVSVLPIKNDLNPRDMRSFLESYRQVDLSDGSHYLEFDAKQYITSNLKEEDILQIKEVFDSFDFNGNGILSPNDLRNALISFGFNASKETIYDIIAEYDEDESGGLSFREFIKMMNGEKKEKISDIEKVFKEFEKKNKGFIDFESLKALIEEIGEDINDSEINEIIKKIDSDGDGRVSFEDFKNVMSKY